MGPEPIGQPVTEEHRLVAISYSIRPRPLPSLLPPATKRNSSQRADSCISLNDYLVAKVFKRCKNT